MSINQGKVLVWIWVIVLLIVSPILLGASFFDKSNEQVEESNVMTEISDKPYSEEQVEEIEEQLNIEKENTEQLNIEDLVIDEQDDELLEVEICEKQIYSNYPDLYNAGVVYYNGYKFTYYSSNVLYHYMTPQWHTNEYGYWCDEDGYLIIASSTLAQGSLLDTPWGTGIVRDSGCAAGVIDMYVSW